MNRLRAAILAAMLALVATPARADKSFDFLLDCTKRKLFNECMAEYNRRFVPRLLPHAPAPVPRPRPKPAPGQWDI